MNLILYLVRGGGHNILINTGPPQDMTESGSSSSDFRKPRLSAPKSSVRRTS
jgi:hypothetical protein